MDLYTLLRNSGLTQQQLASRLGIRQPSVHRWGRRGIPLDRIVELEGITGIPREEIAPALYAPRKKFSSKHDLKLTETSAQEVSGG